MGKEETNDSMDIYEPLKEYRSIYKSKHNQNVTDFFDALVLKAQIDQGLNKSTNDKIKKLEKRANTLKSSITKRRILQAFSWIGIIIALVASIYGIMQLVKKITELKSILSLSLGSVALVVLIIVIFKVINPKLKILIKNHDKLRKEIDDLIQEAYQQLEPLNNLFTETMSLELFKKTLPNINMDLVFDSRRLDYLVNKFGLGDLKDLNRSALFIQSGDIKGNPFYLSKELVHELGTKAYTGSITIHWTTTSRSNGKTVTNHHTQTLTETIVRPCPYYTKEIYLVYGNEAAPDLIFSREDSDAEDLNQKQIDKKVSRDIKKLGRKSEKSIKTGGNYTVLGNSEFEVLFGATNRNHETQFRLLFTPLAQKSLLELMKDTEYGYGDDFDFVKHKMINVLYPEHLDHFELKPNPKFFRGYDLEVVKKNFVDFQNEYFRQLYFAFAPVLAIPLYQQHMPHEYIYKDLYDSYVSFYEHESVVNHMNENEFKHPLSTTPNILKTTVNKSKDYKDTITVTAYGYETHNRVDYFTKLGRDGRMHTIPVHWTEYIPVSKDTPIEISVPVEEKELSYQDRIRKVLENTSKQGIDPKEVYKIGLYLAYILKK
ncbi:conserved hypothetical protein [Alteracholeplasma palmae J233]|uniref:Uncharacterized protein n=1 Tax=Alteracholeplasma palmae (strain ATCC 49389 / J233) TaxID=1318466 RepID=U4KJM7_ALTPJ|nr:hypothetical protein [Alteracholeplasma palmae]CCV63593.1 conserved hypothetical protein [Alteracholeplasma palmae J233]